MLQVSLLGEQTISDDGTGVHTGSPRTVALVGLLAFHAGAPQARRRIAGLFWPESSDAQALTNLRRELHHLRQVLGREPSLVVTSRDLCWRDSPTCRVDVRAFDLERRAALEAMAAGDGERALTHASAAIELYKGELLPGQYDDWLLEARAELERRCVEMCDLITAERTRTGDLNGALGAARRRVRLQPLEEVGYRTLMRVQADLGDRAGAVTTYHHCASVLERELGVLPDPATRRLFERLMARADTASRPAERRAGLAAHRLVGRSAESGALEEVWRAAVGGRPGFALVRGGAGVGKTRLVAELAETARREGAAVAASQCFGTSGRLALAPVADWMRDPMVQATVPRLDAAWRAEVDRLVPSADGERGEAVDPWQRHRFFEGLARALMGVGRPVLLVLDNLQWCDQETLAFVTFCLRLDPHAPIMVAGTLRDDGDEDPELARWTARMRAAELLTDLRLNPLEPAAAAELAETVGGRPLSAADADLLHAVTGGFPLYVIEAVRGGARPGSAGDLASVLRVRLEAASAPAREVAGLAAAVGTDFTLDLLTEASDLRAGAVVEAVDELWRRRIVDEVGDGYDFSHDLLRDAAYAQVSPPKRWLLHRRVAQALELLHADDTGAVSAQLAEQYVRGGRPDRAVAYYRRAADVAAGLFAHAEAVRLNRLALELVGERSAGSGRDLQELAVLEAMAAPLNALQGFSSPELQRTLERSVELAESLDRKESLVTGLVALWTSRIVQGRVAGAYRTAVRAVALAEPGSEMSGTAHFAVGGSAFCLGRPAEALGHLSRVTGGAFALSVGIRPEVHGKAWAAHAHWLLGHDGEALAACREAIGVARDLRHPYSLAVALAYGSITYQMCAAMPELRNTVGELRELCERHDFAYYREWGLVLDGWTRTGDEGLRLARQGIGNLREQGSFVRMPYWLSLLADLLARHGHRDAARATLDAALVGGQTREDLWWMPETLRMRAAFDDPAAAVSRLRSAAQLAATQGSAALLRRCERDLAERSANAAVPNVR